MSKMGKHKKAKKHWLLLGRLTSATYNKPETIQNSIRYLFKEKLSSKLIIVIICNKKILPNMGSFYQKKSREKSILFSAGCLFIYVNWDQNNIGCIHSSTLSYIATKCYFDSSWQNSHWVGIQKNFRHLKFTIKGHF